MKLELEVPLAEGEAPARNANMSSLVMKLELEVPLAEGEAHARNANMREKCQYADLHRHPAYTRGMLI